MQGQGSYSTWVEVDLRAIENNVRYFVTHTKAQVMAVVKANAYGHGVLPVARAALQGGATWLGVARVEEALELRHAGFEGSLLLMGLTPPDRLREMVQQQVSMTVWSAAQIEAVAQAARGAELPARLHLKLDTGMSRLGIGYIELPRLARMLRGTAGVQFEGLFTHFARADEGDRTSTDQQEHLLRQAVEWLQDNQLRPPCVHAANSAASLTRPSAHYDLIRAGIAIYGLHPSPECLLPAAFKPGLVWKTQIGQVQLLPPGRGVSYGHQYVTRGHERIGTLSVGYADGFRRWPGNQVLVRGRRVPVVGRVCMDQCMVQLDAVPEAQPGDEVILIGKQGEEWISAEEVAQCWGTINYEVVCGIGPRVPRFYDPAPAGS